MRRKKRNRRLKPFQPIAACLIRRTQYLTWLFQVMPVFFFVGGFSNAAAWTSARRAPETRAIWTTKRLRRLLLPVVPLVVLWALAAGVAHLLDVDPDLARDTSRAALIPIWFLAVYIMVSLVVPVSFWIWERLGLWSVGALAALAIVIDAIGIGLDQGWLRWANYAPIWLAVHQLGYWWWRDGNRMVAALTILAIGIGWLWVLVVIAGYPISMVSVPGEDFSNTRPPTTAMIALGSVQIGLLVLLAGPTNRWLQRETPWAWVIVVSRYIMTIYLWHLTVVILVAGASLSLGGLGLRVEPGTSEWWGFRPLWIGTLLACLLPFLAVFARFETGSRQLGEHATNTVQAVAGAVLSCAGLTALALMGTSRDGFPGMNWIPVLLVLIGVFVVTRHTGNR